ncbi:hypothetical protein NEDG_01578 [Nematocida displodere]|uniref:RING-type domain-containing protein n=1 Tax=Nematocida displodere TaxID=1805483 RepID=A0A177EGR9_9MICR|nr:hypothetical protein NEDG_01578 [Nematocida displodere]
MISAKAFQYTCSPKNRSAKTLIVWFLALCALASSAQDIEEATALHCAETLAFFAASNCKLRTVKINAKTHILKNQGTVCAICLYKYTLNAIPERMVPGLFFDVLKIEGSRRSYNGPPDSVLFEKIFNALGTLHARKLMLSSLRGVSPPFPAPPNSSYTERLSRAFTNAFCSESDDAFTLDASDSEDDLEPALSLEVLEMCCVSLPFITWFQGSVDMRSCMVALSIHCLLDFDSLEFLDGFKVAGVLELRLHSLHSLQSLTCQLLQEGRVQNVLVIEAIPHTLTVTRETLRGIASRRWKYLKVPESMWRWLIREAEHPICAKTLSLTMHWQRDFEHLVCTPRTTPNAVAQVEGCIITVCGDNARLSMLGLVNLLTWVCISFQGLEDIEVASSLSSEVGALLSEKSFDLKTFPRLTTLRVGNIRCHLHSRKNILCLSFGASAVWASGALRSELAWTSANLLDTLPTDICAMLSPPLKKDHLPGCSVCWITPEEFSGPEEEDPPFLCVLDKAGHVVCSACLEGLVQSARHSDGTFACPMCRQRMSSLLTKYAVTKSVEGLYFLEAAPSNNQRDVIKIPPG